MTHLWPDSPRKKRENSNKQNKRWKKRNLNGYHRKKKKKKREIERKYYEQLHANKFDNLEETYSPPKLNQEETDIAS